MGDQLKKFLSTFAVMVSLIFCSANEAHAVSLTMTAGDVTGASELIAGNMSYELAFVDPDELSFDMVFGSGTEFPWMTPDQQTAELIRDQLALIDADTPFQANGDNDSLNVYFAASADRVEFVNYWTSGAFSGRSFGPFSSLRVGRFSGNVSVVQVLSATVVPLPASGLLLLSALGAAWVGGRRFRR